MAVTASSARDPSVLQNAVAGGEYSLMRGGPTYRLVRAMLRMAPGAHPGALVAALVFVVSFVPPSLLAWRDGALAGGRIDIPLLQDWYVVARFGVALPLLILGADLSDRLLRGAIRQCWLGGAVGVGARDAFLGALSSVARWRDAFIPEAGCLLLAIAPVLLPALTSGMSGTEQLGEATWMHAADGALTPAGVWVETVSAPLFRFVVLLWLWRFLLWTWLLLRLSRTGLDLKASHPDGAGGLAFLGLAQCRFAILSAVGATLVCGYCLNQMMHAGTSVHELRYLVAGYVVGATLALLAPLLLMAPALARAKRVGLEVYGALGHQAASAFEMQWLRHPPEHADAAPLTDSPHPSSVADFGGVYAIIQAMSIVPVTRWNMWRLLLAALLPFVPIAFLAMSLDELAQRIFHILV